MTSARCRGTSRPRIDMRPDVARDSPISILMVVVFPAPFRPRKP